MQLQMEWKRGLLQVVGSRDYVEEEAHHHQDQDQVLEDYPTVWDQDSKLVEHAVQLCYETETDYCRRAIKKEMKNVRVAFQQYNEGLDGPQGPSSLQGNQMPYDF